jgi:protein gp37
VVDRFKLAEWGLHAPRRITSADTLKKRVKWNTAAKAAGVRARVFCASWADVFEDNVDVKPARARLWKLIAACEALDWLLLTKRPENVLDMVPEEWRDGFPPNVWIGTSVEDQKRADERVPLLVKIPARVRFISAEPLVARVSLVRWLRELHWVIVGGESGTDDVRREMDAEWARVLFAECSALGVPFFFKQFSGRKPGEVRNGLDGAIWREFPS